MASFPIQSGFANEECVISPDDQAIFLQPYRKVNGNSINARRDSIFIAVVVTRYGHSGCPKETKVTLKSRVLKRPCRRRSLIHALRHAGGIRTRTPTS